MTSADWDTATNAIESFYGPCYGEALFLLFGATIWEWTGHYPEPSYEPSGWWAYTKYSSSEVGFHYDQVGNAWLWAHEGAHGDWNADEPEAIERANECLQIEG